jgi:hypothetical protein
MKWNISDCLLHHVVPVSRRQNVKTKLKKLCRSRSVIKIENSLVLLNESLEIIDTLIEDSIMDIEVIGNRLLVTNHNGGIRSLLVDEQLKYEADLKNDDTVTGKIFINRVNDQRLVSFNLADS